MDIKRRSKRSFVILISILLVLNLFITPAAAVFSQDWMSSYGGEHNDSASCAIRTDDGGFLLVGSTNSFNTRENNNIYVVKTNGRGYKSWSKIIGGDDDEEAVDAYQTDDGGYLIVGSSESYPGPEYDIFLVRLNKDGDELWNKTYGGDHDDKASSIVRLSDGNFLITGTTISSDIHSEDYFAIKIDKMGSVIWEKVYGGKRQDVCTSVSETENGNIVLSGFSNSFTAKGHQAWIIKLNSTGEEIWNYTYGGSKDDEIYTSLYSSKEVLYFAGGTESYGEGGYDFWLLKLEDNGEEVWNKTYGGKYNEIAHSMIKSDGYILAGSTNSFGSGGNDFHIVKVNHVGTFEFRNTFGGDSDDEAFCIIPSDTDEYVMAGRTKSYGSGEYDFWLVKLVEPEKVPLWLTIVVGAAIVGVVYIIYLMNTRYRRYVPW